MKVSLFVTCIVDLMFPRVGLAAVEVLRRHRVEVAFNPDQTCCGQPAFNTGYRDQARAVALHMVDVFERELESADYIVAPSGSCTTMVRKFYAELFESDPATLVRVEKIASRIFELSEFLVDILEIQDTPGKDVLSKEAVRKDIAPTGVVNKDLGGTKTGPTAASDPRRVTYHDCCHLLRELGVSRQPRLLIQSVPNSELIEMDRSEACCGFGGTFSVKYPEISGAIGEEKIASIERSGAGTVVACDSSCLMQIAGLAARRGLALRCVHLAEFLASAAATDTDQPP